MPKGQPKQHRNPLGIEAKMIPKPESENPAYKAAGKFKNKVLHITGADSGIGKATAIAFAKEGASVAINYLSADDDAQKTKKRIEELGQKCLLLKGDVGDRRFCVQV